MKFVLGSSSPRRIELFKKLNLNFKTVKFSINENRYIHKQAPVKTAKSICREKMKKLKKYVQNKNDAIYVTADTIVYKNEIIMKPENRKDAFKILKKLSDSSHDVITAVNISNGNKDYIFYERSSVFFMKLREGEINRYLNLDEFHDKAGGYAIQGYGGFFIRKIKGDYFNIVGFPVNRFIRVLNEKFGINLI